jgi:hypothetical protein
MPHLGIHDQVPNIPIAHCQGHNLIHSRIGFALVTNADPAVAQQDSVEIQPLSLLWEKCLEVPMGFGRGGGMVVPVYDSGDMSSWMTVIRLLSRLRLDNDCCCLWGNNNRHQQQDIVSWLDVSHCRPSLLIRLFLEQRGAVAFNRLLRRRATREGSCRWTRGRMPLHSGKPPWIPFSSIFKATEVASRGPRSWNRH